MAIQGKNFTASLDGVTANDLAKKLDRNKSEYKDRLKHVEDILDNTEFFNIYYEEYFNPNINMNEYIASESNISVLLENYASYLLNSEHCEEEVLYKIKNGELLPKLDMSENAPLESVGGQGVQRSLSQEPSIKYEFYTDENNFRKALNRDMSIEGMSGNGATEHVIDFLLNIGSNFKKSKDQTITSKDLNRTDFLGSVLRDYQTYLEFLRNIPKDSPNYKRFVVDRIKGSVKQDMIDAKDGLLRVHGYNLRYFSESTEPYYDAINLGDPEQLVGFKDNTLEKIRSNEGSVIVRGLLYMKFNGDFQDDFQCILYDLEKVIERTSLTDKQRSVILMIRNGYSNKEISSLLDIRSSDIMEAYVKPSAKKIAEQVRKERLSLC